MKNTSKLIVALSMVLPTISVAPLFVYDSALADNGSAITSEIKNASNSEIVDSIKNKIASDPLVSNTAIAIRAENGSVILSGLVNTKLQAEKIIMLSESDENIKNVDATDLKIRDSQEPLIDTYITAKVKGMLLRHKLITVTNPNKISVETTNGEVYLSGEVDKQSQIAQAINIARSIADVKNVRHGLTVK